MPFTKLHAWTFQKTMTLILTVLRTEISLYGLSSFGANTCHEGGHKCWYIECFHICKISMCFNFCRSHIFPIWVIYRFNFWSQQLIWVSSSVSSCKPILKPFSMLGSLRMKIHNLVSWLIVFSLFSISVFQRNTLTLSTSFTSSTNWLEHRSPLYES
jgi:hypothetical protein